MSCFVLPLLWIGLFSNLMLKIPFFMAISLKLSIAPNHLDLLTRTMPFLSVNSTSFYRASNKLFALCSCGSPHSFASLASKIQRPIHLYFILNHNSATAYLLFYVDDIILTTNSTELLRSIISKLRTEFSMTIWALSIIFLVFMSQAHPLAFFSFSRTICSWSPWACKHA